MQNKSNEPIFIHSLWRAGSTYVFNVFRRSTAGYWAYQEPIHEIALSLKDDPDALATYTSDTMAQMRHPLLEKPYFYELQQTHSAWHSVIEKGIVYDEYFASTCSVPLKNYIQALISASQGRPVIQECRTSGRIGAIKSTFGGVHIYLWRNPWDQWWSFKLNDYFDAACQIILSAHDAPPLIVRLREEIGYSEFHHPDIAVEFDHYKHHPLTAENSYLIFYALWCLALIEGNCHADMILNIDSLSTAVDYRDQKIDQLNSLGLIGLDFTDCEVSQGYFNVNDIEFFSKIEERVTGWMQVTGYSKKDVDFVRQEQSQYAPIRQENLDVLARDLRRARETVMRLVTSESRYLRELHIQLHVEQQRAEVEKAELYQSNQNNLDNLQHQNAEYERIKIERISDLNHQLSFLHVDYVAREKNHSDRAETLKQELVGLLLSKAQREQDVAAQLLALQQQTAQEKAELTRQHSEQMQALRHEYAVRERAIDLQREASQQELRRLEQQRAQHEQEHLEFAIQTRIEIESGLRFQIQREQEIATQLSALQLQAQREMAAQAQKHSDHARVLQQEHVERERAIDLQWQASQQELRHLEQERAQREKEHLEQINLTKLELEDCLRYQVLREQEVATQLCAFQQQAQREMAKQVQTHSEQVSSLHSEYTEREQTIRLQWQSTQQELRRLEQEWAQREKVVVQEIAELQSATQALHHAHQLQQQQHGFDINCSQEKHNHLTESYGQLEQQLRNELYSEHQISLQLQQALAEVQHSLALTHASLTWRIAAPLRKLTSLISPKKNTDSTSVYPEEISVSNVPTAPAISTIHIQHPIIEPTMSLTAAAIDSPPSALAFSLDELLAKDDEYFIRYAYQTLLGREPDTQGMAYYLGRLRTGFAKIQIVTQLRLSEEGRALDLNLPGLKAAIQQYRRGQYVLVGWLFRLLEGSEGSRPVERKLRAIEQQLRLFSDESRRRFNHMESALADLHHLVEQRQHISSTVIDGATQTLSEMEGDAVVKNHEPEGFSQLTPRAKDIYYKLKSARALNETREA